MKSNGLPQRGLFITGTDTGVGKTAVGAALVKALAQTGLDVQPRKPVESGCSLEGGDLLPGDGLTYQAALSQPLKLEIITPYRFAAALAPPTAARLENKTITLAELGGAVRNSLSENSCCIVEGAGGFYSPIAEDGLNADLAQKLGLPVLLIAADRLGCINHILLTLEAIHRRGLECVALVLNRTDQNTDTSSLHNAAELTRLISTPVIDTDYSDTSAPDVSNLLHQLHFS